MRLTTREQLVVQLLRARDFAQAGGPEGAVRTGDSGVSTLPHEKGCRVLTGNGVLHCTCWLRSMAELDRQLANLRLEEPSLWRAVRARFLLCERRPRTVQVKRGRPVPVPGQEVLGLLPVRGRERDKGINHKGDGTCRVLVESWDPLVRESDWMDGVAWVAARFEGPLRLPSEVLSMAAA